MADQKTDFLLDMEDESYSFYVCHCVAYFPKYFVDPNAPQIAEKNFCLQVYFASKTEEEAVNYYNKVMSKIENEIGGTSERINQIETIPDLPKLYYSVVANKINYRAQDILQDSFSLKDIILDSKKIFALVRKSYSHCYSDALKKITKIGIHGSIQELHDYLLEDLMKANKLGLMEESKENPSQETFDENKYEFCVAPISVYETVRDEDGTMDVDINTIYVAAKDIKSMNKYKDIVVKKINKESFHAYRTDVMLMCYSAAANSVDYDSQNVLQNNYSIKDHIKNDSIDVSLSKVPSALGFGVYSDVLKKLVEVGIYFNPERLRENYFEDMVAMAQLGLEDNMEECCCAGGMGGGVTTASFAPAVTHTVYPRPNKKKKKKKSKKEDNESKSIDDIYGYYGCVVRLSLSFPGSDTKIRKYYVVLGKDLGQIDEFNQKINQNIKQISNDSCILSTTLTSMLYSTEIKDFDFEGQKILDSSLYVNDPKKFISNEKQLDQEEVQIRDIMGRSSDDLVDFTNDLFTKLTEDTKPDYTIEDMYGFYSTLITISFGDGQSKYLDFLYEMGTNYMVLIGKTPEQLKEFIERIRKHISVIDRTNILETEEICHLYSTEIKDFDFEGQKILDNSFFVNDPEQMKANAKTLVDDQVRIKKIIIDSSDDLVDFTDNLLSKMTEDTDDVYWPVRNDETDAFEKMIKDERKAKKDKIIARKEKAINKRDETLFNWLRKMAADDNYSTVAIHTKAVKYNAVTDKMRADLNRIKRLPLDSSEFSPK